MPKLNKILTFAPVGLFLLIVFFNYLFAYLQLNDDNYTRIYFNTNEIIGTPLIGNLYMLGTCYRYKLCLYNKVSVLGLLLLNILNLITINTSLDEWEYYSAIMNIMIAPIVLLALILLIKKI
jgi:peptidoglycan/LPS O-acetylase OafA/YrhL